ncbi:MAG: AbrB/MazE/SpoVT family DNA-binding domain-containing protein [Candidatus Diapherotrites archaeon]|nr:AbrB/MazE/SpoVT family DNA-binding domain-containing protein [Candidatus Diapherotrites archaeon]
MGVIVRVRKIGGSLVATIPKEKAKELNLHTGDPVELELNTVPKDLFGYLKGKKITFTEKDRWDARE